MQSLQLLRKGRLNVGFIDGQWGSSGKGKFNALIAETEQPDFSVSHNSVNASHIVVWDDGRSYKFQHLPTSVVCPKTKVVMGAGASIDLPQMLKEIKDWGLTPDRLYIHPNAVVITDEDIQYEKDHLLRIASTMTGNGAAAGRKVMRSPGVKTAVDFQELQPFIVDTYELVMGWLKEGKTGVLETAQGFDLSMDHGMVFEHGQNQIHRAYPYTTSRNVDPLTFAGMTGVPGAMLGHTLLNLRAFPIRVGDGSNNERDGLHHDLDLSKASSGAFYPDQQELTWEQITEISGSDQPIMEMTSLTKRKRRVFTFSIMQLHNITRTVMPTYITLNFVNYLDASIYGLGGAMSRSQLKDCYPKVWDLVSRVERYQYWANTEHAGQVVALGTGPAMSHYINLVG